MLQHTRLVDSPKFRQYDPSEVRLLSFVATQPSDVIESNGMRLQLASCAASAWVSAPLSLDLALGGVELPVALMPHDRWSELLLPTVRELPQQLLAAIVSHLMEPVITGIAEWTSTAPQIMRWPSQYAQGTRSCFALNVQSTSSEAPYKVLIAILSPAVVDLFTARAGRLKQHQRSDTHLLFAPSFVVLSRIRLLASELREVDVGDVVLLDCTSPSPFPKSVTGTFVVGNTTVAAGEIRANSFFIGSVERHAMDLSTASTSLNPLQMTDSVDSLQLTCRVVIAAGEVRINELTQWAIGTPVPLPISIDSDQVLLQVGHQNIARGRLVAIGEQLGLEIVETFVR
jgi:type III secretion system YscQ/HrcQ family protein